MSDKQKEYYTLLYKYYLQKEGLPNNIEISLIEKFKECLCKDTIFIGEISNLLRKPLNKTKVIVKNLGFYDTFEINIYAFTTLLVMNYVFENINNEENNNER